MPAGIQEHVRERIPHLARGPEHAHVISIREDGPRAAEDPIDGSREARPQRLHATTQGAFVIGFHDQVRVVRLDRVVNEPKIVSFAAGGEAPLEIAHQSDGSQ